MLVKRGVVYSRLLYCPKFSMEIPCVGVLWGQVSGFEILLGEGRDVELGARTSKQILLFVLDPIDSLSLLCALIILLYHILACV